MAVLLLLSPSSSPASRICSNWLLSVYSVGCCVCFALWLRPWQIFRDEDFLLLIVVSSNPISWLLLDCIVFYCAPLKSTQIPIDCCVDRHVICASHASALPSGGDYLHCAIICSLVEGHGGGCAKDGSTINGANTPARGEDVREGICGVWLELWLAEAAMPWLFRWGGGLSSRGTRALREQGGSFVTWTHEQIGTILIWISYNKEACRQNTSAKKNSNLFI